MLRRRHGWREPELFSGAIILPFAASTSAGSVATLASVFVVYARFLKDSGASSPTSSSSSWNAKTMSRSSPSSSGPGHHRRNLSPPIVPELDRLLRAPLREQPRFPVPFSRWLPPLSPVACMPDSASAVTLVTGKVAMLPLFLQHTHSASSAACAHAPGSA